MLRLIFSFIILFSFVTILPAQSDLESGSITFQLADVESDDAEVKQQMEMLNGSTTKLIFSDEYAMLEMQMMEGLISMKTRKTLKNGNTNIYLDMMGNKVIVPMSNEERQKLTENAAGDEDDWSVNYDKSETKTIKGYDCYKAVVSNSTSKLVIDCYITEEIKADTKLIYGFESFELDGFPLEYSSGVDGTGATFTASEINASVDNKIFDIDDSSYTKMSFEDFMEMSQSLGSGMGF